MRLRRSLGFLLILVMSAACLLAPASVCAAASMTIADMVQIARYMNGQTEFTAEQIEVYDLNKDGRVNVADLVAVARIITGSVPAGPSSRPDYDQIIYSQGSRNVTVGDLTQVGYLVGGMLGAQDKVDLAANGVPARALLGGLYDLNEISLAPEEMPVAGPLAKSLLKPVASVLSKSELSGGGTNLWTVPGQPFTAMQKEIFGSTKVTDNVDWTEGSFTVSAQSGCAQEVTLVQFARYRHTTLALAIYDVTIKENAFGMTPGKVRVGMQFEISTNSICILPISLMRLRPDQLEQESDMTAVLYPSTVPV